MRTKTSKAWWSLGTLGSLGLLAACGGGTEPNPPPPPPPPDNTRAASIQAGDEQRALTGQPVAIAPAIKVVNRAGAAVAGVQVTFAIGLCGAVAPVHRPASWN